MPYKNPFGSALFACYVAGVLCLAWSPLRTMIQPGYQGILYKGQDESQYIMRVNEAMRHPFTDVSNSIVTGPNAPRGLQMTLPESLAGSLLSWTGISAPSLTILLSILLAPLFMPFFASLALRFGVRRRYALLGAVLLFFLLIGPLRRVIHQAWSLPFVMLVLLLMTDWWKNPTRQRSFVLGAALGVLPGIYFWAWTYLWSTFGFVIILTIVAEARHRSWKALPQFVTQALIAGCTALLIASPFLLTMWRNSHNPASVDAGYRSSLIAARELESLPRSAALVVFAVFAAIAMSRQTGRRRLLPLLAMVLALLAVLHQQFVHGLVLSYWTHYYPYVCAISMLVALVFSASRIRFLPEIGAICTAAVFLFAAFSDYHGRASIFSPLAHWQSYQHLAPALQALNRIDEKQAVLTDHVTSLIVGTYTDHDVVFTRFMRHTLVHFPELAERECLTQYVTGRPPDTEWLPHDVEELSAAGKAKVGAILERDLVLTKAACDEVYKNPKAALSRYGVSLVLWDEKNYPDWKIPTAYFTVGEKGAGWSMWHVK